MFQEVSDKSLRALNLLERAVLGNTARTKLRSKTETHVGVDDKACLLIVAEEVLCPTRER